MILPDNILRRMDSKERAKLGKAGVTHEEAQVNAANRCEKEMQSVIEQFCRLKGWPCYRQAMHKRTTGKTGQPDFLICVPFSRSFMRPIGHFVAIECKMKGNKTSPEQMAELISIDRCNGSTLIAYSAAEAIDFLVQLARLNV